MKKLATLNVLLFLAFSTHDALGCLCALEPNATPERINEQRLNAFEKATVVFTGEVVSLDLFSLRLKVDKMWKGEEAKEIAMLTGTKNNGDGTFSSSSCDYGFVKGQKYLVYAYGPLEALKTHACSRTSLLKYAELEIKALDEITPHKSVFDELKLEQPTRMHTGRNPTSASVGEPVPEPFYFSSRGTAYGVQGEFEGTYLIHAESIEINVTKATIYVSEHCPYQGRRNINQLKFGLATEVGLDGKWKIESAGQSLALGLVMSPKEEYALYNLSFFIPKESGIDLTKRWFVAEIQTDTPDIPEEQNKMGYVYAFSCKDIFHPPCK